MDEEAVPFLGRDTPIVRFHDSAPCSVDCFPIDLHPFSHLFQALDGYFGQFPVGLRTDIHQQVGVLAGRVYQIMNQLFGRLIVLVGDFIPPHTVHGFTSLQRQLADALSGKSGFVLAGQVPFENLDILTFERSLMMIVPNQASRLQAMNHRILLRELPVEVRILVMIPPSVKPDSPDRAVVGQQLRQLVIHKLIIILPFAMLGAPRPPSGPSQRIIILPEPV